MQMILSDVFAFTNSELLYTVRENEGADAKGETKYYRRQT